MPYEVKRKSNGKYQMINKITGRVHAKNATKENAVKQMKLLYCIEHGGCKHGPLNK